MRILIIIFLFSCFVNSTSAQTNIDSLRREASKKEDDSVKLNSLVELARDYLWTIPDSSIYFGIQGLPIARKLNLEKTECILYLTTGEALSGKGSFAMALEYQLKGLKIAEKINDPEAITWAWANAGSVYFYSHDYDNALNYYKKLNTYPEIYNDYEVQFSAFLGEAYFYLGKIDSAFVYINHSYELIREHPSWTVPFYYMGNIFAARNQFQQALEFYRSGIRYSKNVTLPIIEGYNGIAAVFFKNANFDSAIYYAGLGLTLSQDHSFSNKTIESSSILKDVYKKLGRTDSAFKYQEIMLAAKDSVYSQAMMKQMQNLGFNEQLKQQEIKAENESYRNRLKMYAVIAAGFILLIVAVVLWRNNLRKQKDKLKIEQAYHELKSTQAQLIQSEKMASLGELTAGIAHEIQNPLNFVNNFSEVSNELLDEMKTELDKGEVSEAKIIAGDVKQNLEKILHHGKRADAIVKSMLQHSRTSSGKKELTDVNELADEYLRLAYHGLRAKDKSFNATFETDFDDHIGKINIIPQDIGRVLLNLFTNAFYSVTAKQKSHPENYNPVVSVSTKKINDNIQVRVRDNGMGIPQKAMDKIFQPFFTTKPTGEGTGLGLSLSYDIIVKGHGGELKADTKEGEFAEFIIQLPVQ